MEHLVEDFECFAAAFQPQTPVLVPTVQSLLDLASRVGTEMRAHPSLNPRIGKVESMFATTQNLVVDKEGTFEARTPTAMTVLHLLHFLGLVEKKNHHLRIYPPLVYQISKSYYSC